MRPLRVAVRGGVGLVLLAVAAPAYLVAMAGPAAAVECTIGKTQYVEQASPALVGLGIPQSWRVATGKGVTVAVVDSGVNTDNAHLPADKVVLAGKSFVPGDPNPDARTDPYGHGTAVAGIIAARPVPGVKSAMIGAAPGARILPVRVFTADAADSSSLQPGEYRPDAGRTAQGIRWAADNGADVINVSLSAPANNTDLVAMRRAVDHALSKGVVVVASAGDAPGEPTDAARYPAAYDGVLAVAATNADGVVDDYSVHGDWVDVAAPGANVLVAFHANGDCQSNATPMTSWAAPFVSASAAQLVQRFPRAGPEEIGYRITSTAQRPVADRRDDRQGWGLIQPYAALTAAFDPRRPGPAAPNQQAETSTDARATPVRPIGTHPDPLEPARTEVVWWVLGAGGAAALALVLRPLVRDRRRPPG